MAQMDCNTIESKAAKLRDRRSKGPAFSAAEADRLRDFLFPAKEDEQARAETW